MYGKTSASPSAPGPSLGVPRFLSLSSPLLLQPPHVGRERQAEAGIQAKKSRAATLHISWFPFVLEAPWRGPRLPTEPRGFGPIPHRGGRDLEGPGGASSRRVWSCPLGWLKPGGQPAPAECRLAWTRAQCSETNNTQLSRTSEAPFIQAPWSQVSPTACPSPQCPRPQTTAGPRTYVCLALSPSRWE